MTGRVVLTMLRPSNTARCLGIGHPCRSLRHFTQQSTHLQDAPTYSKPQGPMPKVPIHLTGFGAMGMYVAAALGNVARPPPVTLLSHTTSLLRAWRDSDRTITIESHDDSTVVSSRFGMTYAAPIPRTHGISARNPRSNAFNLSGQHTSPHQVAKDIAADPPTLDPEEAISNDALEHDPVEDIQCLIVTVKCPRTVPALDSLKHRLNSNSTIVFLQNGLGQQDELNEKVFPDPATRPQYVSATVSHGVTNKRDPFSFRVRSNGYGHIFLSPTPRPLHLGVPDSLRYIVDVLSDTPMLRASVLPPVLFRERQFMKLAANAVINPLTALTDLRNGSLLKNYAMTKTMRLLIAEISLILRSLPELQPPAAQYHYTRGDSHEEAMTDPYSTLNKSQHDDSPYPSQHLYNFSPSRIENQVLQVAGTTRNNISSMLVDVRKGLKTEIDYLNGYIVRRGMELGIAAPVNSFVANAVRAKQMAIDRENRGDVPLRET